MILHFILFIFFLLLFIYVPSCILLRKIHFNKAETDPIIRFGITLILGICLLVLEGLILGILHISYKFLWLVPVFLCIIHLQSSFLSKKNLLLVFNSISLNVKLLGIIIIISISSFFQSFVLLRGGILSEAGFTIPSLHDTGWNLSIMDSLTRGIPPEHPSSAGVILKNNHYFYPLFLAIAEESAAIDRFDLYFRFAPILVSVLFGIGIYSFSSIFVKKYFFRLVSVLLGYWGGNFSYLAPLYFGRMFEWKGNSFYADQPFDQLVNPYTVLGFTLLLFGIYVLNKAISTNTKKLAVIPIIIFGMLFGFKSFGGILVILSLFFSFAASLIISRKKISSFQNRIPLIILLGSFILFIPVFFLIANIGKSSIIWIPGWILNQMVTSNVFLQKTGLGDTEAYYYAIGNTLGLMKIKTIELGIYTFFNFGTRIFGFLFIVHILIKAVTARNDKTGVALFIISIVVLAYLFPLLFNLRFSSFNIIQFTPYAFIILDSLSSGFFEKLYMFSRSRFWKYAAVLGVCLVFVLSFPVNIENAVSQISSGVNSISKDEYAALVYLDSHTDKKDVILINPDQYRMGSNENIPIYTRFLSRRSIYFISSEYLTQTGNQYEDRYNKVNIFFDNPTRNFLITEKINYIYMLKSVLLDYESFSGVKSLDLPVFYENNTVVVFKT